MMQREDKDDPPRGHVRIAGCNVMTVGAWFRGEHFENEEQAKGAFELAYQQWLDGLGFNLSNVEYLGVVGMDRALIERLTGRGLDWGDE